MPFLAPIHKRLALFQIETEKWMEWGGRVKVRGGEVEGDTAVEM